MPLSHYPAKPIYVRWWFWVPLVLVALVLIAAAVASPIAAHYTRKALGELEGHRGEFSRVRVNLFTLTYTIHDLRIVEDPTLRGRQARCHRSEDQGGAARLPEGAADRGDRAARPAHAAAPRPRPEDILGGYATSKPDELEIEPR